MRERCFRAKFAAQSADASKASSRFFHSRVRAVSDPLCPTTHLAYRESGVSLACFPRGTASVIMGRYGIKVAPVFHIDIAPVFPIEQDHRLGLYNSE